MTDGSQHAERHESDSWHWPLAVDAVDQHTLQRRDQVEVDPPEQLTETNAQDPAEEQPSNEADWDDDPQKQASGDQQREDADASER
jgi:hypothetical protein